MPFNGKSGKFNAAIRTVEIGTGDKAVKLGGECVSPLYSFDAPIENAPKVGVLITDYGFENESEGIKAYYEGCANWGEIAQKAAAMEGADFLALSLEGGDPNGADKSIEELIAIVKEVADAVDCPLVVEGCKNVEKDALLEIYAKLKYHHKTNKTMAQAKLVNGVVLKWQGNHYTNANLTDEVAEAYLKMHPEARKKFERVPQEHKSKAVEALIQDAEAETAATAGVRTTKKEKAPKNDVSAEE